MLKKLVAISFILTVSYFISLTKVSGEPSDAEHRKELGAIAKEIPSH